MFVPFPHCLPIPHPTQSGSYPHHSTEISLAKLQMISQLLNSMDAVCFPSLYTKIGKTWRRLSWSLDKEDKQIHAVSHIFIVGTHFVIYRHISRQRIYLHTGKNLERHTSQFQQQFCWVMGFMAVPKLYIFMYIST